MIIVLCITGWLACAVVTAGAFVAYFQRAYPEQARKYYRTDFGAGILLGLMAGPLGVLLSCLLSGFCEHGWTLLPPNKE
jgi:hypothetical protein